MHPDDRDLQRIVWRKNPSHPLQEYRLNTVTYGLACAPYLAVRTLRQLAADEATKFPLGAKALLKDVYVDDVLTGADSVEKARDIQTQLISLCKSGGFLLRKWSSNQASLLASVADKDRLQNDLRRWDQEPHSMLGLQWNPGSDCFLFVVQVHPEGTVTKRFVLSLTARFFNPLDWLSPVIIREDHGPISMVSRFRLGSPDRCRWNRHVNKFPPGTPPPRIQSSTAVAAFRIQDKAD